MRPVLAFLLSAALILCASESQVYVYELPEDLNVMWTSAAFDSDSEATRKYAVLGDEYAKTELTIHQEFLRSEHRTTLKQSAALFLVPVYTSILIHHAHLDVAEQNLQSALEHIRQLGMWDRFNGSDHVFMFTHPSGPCSLSFRVQALLAESTILHWAGAPRTCDLVVNNGVAVPLFAQSLSDAAFFDFLGHRKRRFVKVDLELFSFCAPNCVSSESDDPDEKEKEFRLAKSDMLNKMQESHFCGVDDPYSLALAASIVTECIPIIPTNFEPTFLALNNAINFADFILHEEIDTADPAISNIREKLSATKSLVGFGSGSRIISALVEEISRKNRERGQKPPQPSKKRRDKKDESRATEERDTFWDEAVARQERGAVGVGPVVVFIEDQEQGVEGMLQGFVSTFFLSVLIKKSFFSFEKLSPRLHFLFRPKKIKWTSVEIESLGPTLQTSHVEFSTKERNNLEILTCGNLSRGDTGSFSAKVNLNLITLLVHNPHNKDFFDSVHRAASKKNLEKNIFNYFFDVLAEPSEKLRTKIDGVADEISKIPKNENKIGLHIPGEVTPITHLMIEKMVECAMKIPKLKNTLRTRIFLSNETARFLSEINRIVTPDIIVQNIFTDESLKWKWEWGESAVVQLYSLAKLDAIIVPENSLWDISASLGHTKVYVCDQRKVKGEICKERDTYEPDLGVGRGIVNNALCLHTNTGPLKPLGPRSDAEKFDSWLGKTSTEIFKNFVAATRSKVEALPLNPAGLPNTDRTVVFVEHGEDPLISYTVHNMMHFLGPSWALIIYHVNSNENFFHRIFDGKKYPTISLRNLNKWGMKELSWHAYNSLLLTRHFWEDIDQEHILIAHTDALMLRHNDLSKFLKFDFIGSPWRWCVEPWCMGGGNGGMSLRRRSAMLRVMTIGFKMVMAEDQLFTHFFHEHGGAIPTQIESAEFSVESMRGEILPAATHAFWKHNSPRATFDLLSEIDYDSNPGRRADEL